MSEPDDMTAMAAAAMETWDRVVAREGRSAEWTPELVTVDDDGKMCVYVLMNPGDPYGGDVVPAIAEAARLVVGPTTKWVSVTVDAYTTADQSIARRVEAGEVRLGELYARGVEGVVDCLFVYAANRERRASIRMLPYRIRSKRVHWLQIDWPQEMGMDGIDMSGRIPEALIGALVAAGER